LTEPAPKWAPDDGNYDRLQFGAGGTAVGISPGKRRSEAMTQEAREFTQESAISRASTADPRTARMRQTIAELVAIERALVASYRWAAGRTEVVAERDKLRDFGRAH